MKKLFTTILMMGVALCGWATITPTYEGTTLTLNYVDDGYSDDQNFNINNYNSATTIVLTGDWANKDLQKIGTLVGQCQNKVFLDLSACSNMRSKVVKADGTYNADIDWVTTEHKFLPDPNNPETVNRTGTAYESSKYYYSYALDGNGNPQSWASPGNGIYVGDVTQNGDKYYDQNGQEVIKKSVYVDEKGKELPSDADITENIEGDTTTYSYSYTYTLDTTPFSLSGNDFSNNADKLKGIAFPNHADFNYIPKELCMGLTNLTSVDFGDYMEWIGEKAFMGCTALTNPTFPTTMKVFDKSAFRNCSAITAINLSVLPKIQKIDYYAFGFEDGKETNLATFTLPTSDNTSLKFFGNYVVRGSLVETLDFTHCLGIKNFAYDGKNTMNENFGSYEAYWTFYNCPELTSVILPPNLSYLTDKAFNSCGKLQKVIFTGTADYDKDTCPETNKLNNPLIIGESVCADLPVDSLVLSNNVTEIRYQAFARTALKEVRIPASVELIGNQAFDYCHDADGNKTMKIVVFEEIDSTCTPCKHAKTHIVQEAFLQNSNITDVYINTEVDITCENEGFSRDITFAQGNATGNAATLHFPAGHEEHYTNLKHFLTDSIAKDPGKFQRWLVEHMDSAQNAPTGFGWYEFVNTGTKSIDKKNPDPEYNPDPENPDQLPLILRTFSDPKYARIVPDGLRAYIVNKVEKSGNKYELTLQRLSVIPAQTGVVLFGQPNSKTENGKYIVSMTTVAFKPGQGNPLRRDYWDMLSSTDQHFKNYLMPIIDSCMVRTVEEGGNQAFTKTNLLTVNPYEPYKVKNAPVEWRNFALNRLDSTANLKKKFSYDASVDNYAGFFRILPGTYKSGYAYLHLSADEYDSATGAECVVNEDEEYWKEYNTKGVDYDPRKNTGNQWWSNNNNWTNVQDGWGARDNDIFDHPGALTYLGELEDTDGIVKLVIPENKMDEVFSISGMKVTNPSKGIYIQNGKKVIIK